MVGDGVEKERAENLCNELGIADKVIFLGNKQNGIDRILNLLGFIFITIRNRKFRVGSTRSYGMECSSNLK